MIPTIGVMMAAYIFTRMVELLASEGKTIVKVFAVITLLIACVGAVDLLNSGSSIPAMLR